jgi:ABC-type dipeptide/oligopeptide/nickel transport system ATPase component
VRTIMKRPEHPYTRLLLDSVLDNVPMRAPLEPLDEVRA